MADLIAATVAILKDANLADGRAFGVELPQEEHASMPRTAAVVRGSGGSQTLSQHWMRTGDIRVDVRWYGVTPFEAAGLEAEGAAVLHLWQGGATDHGRVLWFRQAGGPNQLRDPDTDWPYALSTWQVYGDRY